MKINELIEMTRSLKGSDLHIIAGEPPCVRINGKVHRMDRYGACTPEAIELLTKDILSMNEIEYVESQSDYDFAHTIPTGERQRVNIFMQKGSRGLVLRMLNSNLPTLDELKLPEIFKQIAGYPRGMVLVTGPTGSGKTTTLSAMIDHINNTKHDHILTIEDPIEYVHKGKKCIVNQREVGVDVTDFSTALRGALREDPDIILVGEMRDIETIGAAITASETGHFVMGTLHTTGAAKTIDRLIDAFPAHQQAQVRTQLATVLRAVITQTLVPTADGTGRVPAFEILLINDAVSNLIREGKTFQIDSVIQTNLQNGMVLLDNYLATLVKARVITKEDALDRAVNRAEIERYLSS